jgi:prepilin-type N-terminal cleavage/methylation domain-containing protein
MLKKLRPNTSRGDTIVEVMIVLAILGFAISIAFATANRSLINARQAQEHSEATAFVQSQIEALRSRAAIDTETPAATGIFETTRTSPFCLLNNPPGTLSLQPLTSTPPAVTDCLFGTASRYQVYIYSCDHVTGAPCNAVVTNNNTFAVQAQWEDVAGDGLDTVTVFYRVHAP